MGKQRGFAVLSLLFFFALAASGGFQPSIVEAATLEPTGCANCHGGDIADRHHTTDDYVAGNCTTTCHTTVTTQGDCNSCHSSNGLTNKHHLPQPPDNLPVDCGGCHTGLVDLGGCLNCHLGKVLAPHHAAAKASSISCKNCHTTLEVAPAANAGCRDCHIGSVRVRHHRAAVDSGTSCTGCHAEIVQNLTLCHNCHSDPLDPLLIRKIHHDGNITINYPAITCYSCHPGGSLPMQADCVTCHTTIVTTASIADQHHMTLSATTEQCGTCHKGVSPVVGCTECHEHNPDLGFSSLATHHSPAPSLYSTGDCTSTCHKGAEAQGIVCVNCHSGSSELPPNHHQQPQAVTGDCTTIECHSGIQQKAAGCLANECHPGDGASTHHGAPLEEVELAGGSCANCHQAASDPALCANCHLENPHHSTDHSLMGDCTKCHKVPAEVADRPKQAACRECHGTSMHDKGGPIQDYGACAACHGTAPFHPKPASNPGYTGYGAGKKKFNLFWSQYAIKEGPGEDIRPNGEDMNDEGGYRIRAQQLSFNKVGIVSGGKAYTVPSFDSADSTATLADCSRCHGDNSELVSCENAAWAGHLTKGHVSLSLSQLAEATYLGSLCPSTPTVSPCDVAADGTYFEAEKYTSLGDNWSLQTGSANGGGYLKALRSNTSSPSGTPVRFNLNFPEAGTYYLWFRGNDQDSSSSNSLWYGLDGKMIGDVASPAQDRNWRWVNTRNSTGPSVAAINIGNPGPHTIDIWSREYNFWLDGIYLIKTSGPLPGGTSATVPTGALVLDPTGCGGETAPAQPANLALGKSATASKSEWGYGAAKAVDGDAGSRWWAKEDSNEYLRVDLGSYQSISKVTIDWHSYYARSYSVQTSTDGSNWSTVYSTSSGSSGLKEVAFSSRNARYVRVYCNSAASSYNGFSIIELGIFQ